MTKNVLSSSERHAVFVAIRQVSDPTARELLTQLYERTADEPSAAREGATIALCIHGKRRDEDCPWCPGSFRARW